MSVVPGGLDTDAGPPMELPLRHFVVALGFLVAGLGVGLAVALGMAPGRATLAHVHLLLVGWVCVTILGATTQFVPVWSGVALHSRRLAAAQLWLVTAGLAGFAAALLTGWTAALPAFGAVLLVGFWTFVYNLARTLRAVEGYDVTERHFAAALAFFLLATALGLLLALDFVRPVLAPLGLARPNVVAAHATLAVFGAVLTTVFGALYQLATVFTQTELHGVDVPIRRFETVGYPGGVVLLAAGRLVGSAPLARLGGVLVVAGVLGVAVVVARRLRESRVPWTPMLARYAVVAPAMAVWGLLALPAWLATPLDPATTFGAPGGAHLLAVGVVGVVVLGTAYHVVPFVVWVGQYSDRLGYEPVPTIEELYDDRVARADLALLLAGLLALVAGDRAGVHAAVVAGGVLVAAGALLFVGNLLLVVHRHGPRGIRGVLLGRFAPS